MSGFLLLLLISGENVELHMQVPILCCKYARLKRKQK